MRAATIAAAKGSILAPELRSRTRVSASLVQFKKSGLERENLLMRDGGFCCGQSPLRLVNMGVGIARVRNGVETIFRSKGKARSIRAQAAAGLFCSLVKFYMNWDLTYECDYFDTSYVSCIYSCTVQHL